MGQASSSVTSTFAAEAQTSSAFDCTNPLQHTGILQHVLDYVGPGHWCFVAEVSSLWRDCYIRVASREIQAFHPYLMKTITCLPQMTLYSAVLSSPSRVRLAHSHRLPYRTTAYERAAGMYADAATLQTLREMGMLYSSYVMAGAARCNQLEVVQFLRAQGCPWSFYMFNIAARRGHTNLCRYLHTEQCPDTGNAACDCAAITGHSGTLRWLRETDFPWNTREVTICAAQGGSVDALQILQQQGLLANRLLLAKLLNVAGSHNR
jgi:hypothetical protein